MSNPIYLVVENADSYSFDELNDILVNKLNGFKDSYGEENEIYQNALIEYWNIIRVRLLNDYIMYAYNKYHKNMDAIMDGLSQYVIEDKATGITRDNGFRDKFKVYLPREAVNSIMGGPNARKYIEYVITNKTDNEKLVIEACKATYKKHGRPQLVKAVEKAINEGSYVGFTNEGGDYRTNMVNNVTVPEFREIIHKIIGPAYTSEISRGDQVANYLEHLRLAEQIEEFEKTQQEGEGQSRK